MMRKIIITLGTCGFVIAVLIGMAWNYLATHTTANPHNAPFLSAATDLLWPSNLMIMAWHDEGRWHNSFGLLLSAFANAAIYSLAGLSAWAIARAMSIRK
jgi:hypothetical protein